MSVRSDPSFFRCKLQQRNIKCVNKTDTDLAVRMIHRGEVSQAFFFVYLVAYTRGGMNSIESNDLSFQLFGVDFTCFHP